MVWKRFINIPGEYSEVQFMNILVTGAKGMVGTALVNNLKNI